MEGLAPRQRDVYDFITRYHDQSGYPPTYQEIADEIGVSKTAVTVHLRALERKGYIRRKANEARTIVVQGAGA